MHTRLPVLAPFKPTVQEGVGEQLTDSRHRNTAFTEGIIMTVQLDLIQLLDDSGQNTQIKIAPTALDAIALDGVSGEMFLLGPQHIKSISYAAELPDYLGGETITRFLSLKANERRGEKSCFFRLFLV